MCVVDELLCYYVSCVVCDKVLVGFVVVVDLYVMVLGSDIEVVLDDEVFGKFIDVVDVEVMLCWLFGCMYEVIFVVWVVDVWY